MSICNLRVLSESQVGHWDLHEPDVVMKHSRDDKDLPDWPLSGHATEQASLLEPRLTTEVRTTRTLVRGRSLGLHKPDVEISWKMSIWDPALSKKSISLLCREQKPRSAVESLTGGLCKDPKKRRASVRPEKMRQSTVIRPMNLHDIHG